MDDVRLGKSIDVKQIKATVSECVQSILRNPDAMLWMSKIKDKDSYTSQHSLNVCILAINFGRHLGAPEDDLGKLGVSALMHDIGKMRVPTEILHKAGPLTAEEQATYEKHPVYGRDILLQQDGLYHGAVDVAYAHHEHIDGTGYPRKIKAAGISDFTESSQYATSMTLSPRIDPAPMGSLPERRCVTCTTVVARNLMNAWFTTSSSV